MLYLIGTGLYYLNDLPYRAVELIRKADDVYLERYTNVNDISFLKELQKITGKEIKTIGRELAESDMLLDLATEKDTVLLVPGDPLSATTHMSLVTGCINRKIKYKVVHASSIFSAVAETGLSLYKFGAVCSIPMYSEGFKPESFFDVIEKNLGAGMHSLVLLEAVSESIFLSAVEGISILKSIEKKRNLKVIDWKNTIIVSRLGGAGSKIVSSEKADRIKSPPISIVIPGALNEMEKLAVSAITEK